MDACTLEQLARTPLPDLASTDWASMNWDWQETPWPSPESPETSICEVPFEGEEATESVKPRKRRRRGKANRAPMSDRARRRLVDSLLRPPSLSERALERPDWRWVRAHKLANVVDRLSPNKASIDPSITRTLKFLRLARRGASKLAVKRDSSLASAFLLWSDHEQKARRSLVEAFLLSDAAHDWIAGTCDLPTRAIEAYATVFYDIGELLKFPLYIHGHVLQPMTDLKMELDLCDLLRLVGYSRGRDAVVRFFLGNQALTPDDKAFLVRMIRMRLTHFVWSYVRNMTVTAKNAKRLVLLAADPQKLKFKGLTGAGAGPGSLVPRS